MTREFYEEGIDNSGKGALVLIQGSGEVRPGQWTRSVCINANMELGSMLPQVDWAVNQQKMAVIILNPNQTRDAQTREPIPLNGTSGEHCLHVWKNYVLSKGFKHVEIIAHSAGGSSLC
mmetsp:Transcript_1413/g.2487  ORF Transcript_1413/g.2487 Transcript_1413/m.2487 type:complete len:119 (+) Transcript_1413:477-833(+)